MTQDNPTMSFVVPYRWFTSDKKFLGDNLVRQIQRTETPEKIKPLQNYMLCCIN